MAVSKIERLPYRRCVGIMLFNREAQVLVGCRVDQKESAWQMPQGGIEDNESPSQAALRELEEEINTANVRVLGESREWHNYDFPERMARKAWNGRYRGQTQKWFAMEFLGEYGEINPSGVDHPEFSDWRWVDLSSLPSLAINFKKDVYESIANEFSILARSLRDNK